MRTVPVRLSVCLFGVSRHMRVCVCVCVFFLVSRRFIFVRVICRMQRSPDGFDAYKTNTHIDANTHTHMQKNHRHYATQLKKTSNILGSAVTLFDRHSCNDSYVYVCVNKLFR